MAYVITEPCIDIKHKTCVDVCPISCIYLESDELDRMLSINPGECIDCGACEPECPENAIFTSDAVPPEWAEYVDLNGRWFEGKAAMRARIDTLKPRAAA